jgi:hypothetical protein
MPRSSDPIFGEKPKNNGCGWLLILILVLGIAYWFWQKKDPNDVIRSNHEKALDHVRSIRKALSRWRRGDYDGNGRQDLPLGELIRLRDTKLVNGRSIRLISEELCRADLRVKDPEPLDGYLFGLVHLDKAWPAGGEVISCAILARPVDPGRSGSCFFYVHTDGTAYYSDYLLSDLVPSYPDARQLRAEIWKPLPEVLLEK